MRSLSSIALVLALAAIATPALAQEFTAGDITIEKSWARATPKEAEVGAGYFVVHNNGDTPDRLTGGSADTAARQRRVPFWKPTIGWRSARPIAWASMASRSRRSR
jgi:copper(I)-binding protein